MASTLAEVTEKLRDLDVRVNPDTPLVVVGTSSNEERPANVREQTILYAFAAAMGMIETGVNKFFNNPDRPLDSDEGLAGLLRDRLHRYPYTLEDLSRFEQWLTTGERLTSMPGEIPPSKFLQQQATALLGSLPA